jgi:dimethylargininase
MTESSDSSNFFTRAIVRAPGRNFATGLTSVDLGMPDYALALEQHEAYCAALERCGLELIRLEADERYPDSTFVEDTAVLSKRVAVVTLPGANSRRGEVESVRELLAQFYPAVHAIAEPGTVDGGDVFEVGSHFFIGISHRTNEAGAQQLAAVLARFDYTSTFVDIRNLTNILHLKSGIAYPGDNHLVVSESLASRAEFLSYDLIPVPAGDEYAANCVRVNHHVLLPAGYPELEGKLRELGYDTIALEMSEFQKMDGGLSCLSLRF